MKILNLFAGIGGNRTLWGDGHEITAVEYDERIADIYAKRFPNDEVVVGDAYEYLELHFREYDFIWASPPCQSHTRLLDVNMSKGCKGMLPDLRMYSIIFFLDRFFEGSYIVENVMPYYTPLIQPTSKVGRHPIWSNFVIPENISFQSRFCKEGTKNLKTQEERNMVDPEIGKYILDCAIQPKQSTLEGFV